MGMCYEYKGDLENAKRCYMKVGMSGASEFQSLEIKPSYRESKLKLNKLMSEVRSEPAASTV